MDQETPGGITRRDMLKRSAVVGGTLVWAAPAVQTFARPAFAQQASPECAIVVMTFSPGPPPRCEITTYAESEDCCDCVSAAIAGGANAFLAALICFNAGRCVFTNIITSVPC